MITVPKIEMHLAHACTLRCTGCAHYADHGLPGVLPLQDGAAWLTGWGARIRPVTFSFLGGEPLLNRRVPDFLRLARGLWPRARLRLVSNGLLLHRKPELWDVLGETGTTLTVSVHSRDDAYLARLRPNLELARARAAEIGFRLEERDSVEGWYKLYRGSGAAMEPFTDGDPRASWTACTTRHCVTLQDNALWKCPPLAHLPLVASRHGLGDRPSWQPYLRYRPLPLTATADEIRAFFARGPESFCGMCPARHTHFTKSVTGAPAPF
ncbi:radical SAM protein [Actinomadura chokoriensis]|uniref:Radical SAM protein n=1 Tax=Actinomadura chokoriensis TaxID=454156 RepID=A0ABV4R3K5_9ACTN